MAKKNLKKRVVTKKTKKPYPIPQSLVIALVALVVAGGALYSVRTKHTITPVQIAEITNTNGSVNLSLLAAKTNLAPQEETTITLKFDAPTTPINVASVDISYNPDLLTISNVTKGEKFVTELVPASTSNGKITFTYGVAVAANAGQTGQGTIATFTVKAKTVGAANLTFNDSTQVLVSGASTNALREITNTTLTIADPNASTTTSPSTNASSSSPSTSPSLEPSVSPSTTPSTDPSTTPSTSPSTSPTSSPVVNKPASPTNLRYNCYSNGTRITLRWDEVTGATSYSLTLDQKDGDNDQTTTSTRAEKDLDIKSNTTYIWKVAASKDSVSGDSATVADIKCTGNNASATPTPSPTPTPTPTPTPAPTKKSLSQTVSNIFKPKSPSPSPSLKSSPVPLASFVPSSPISSPGSLADIFASPSSEPSPNNRTDNTSFISKIFIGWQALFIKLVESLTK